jgi:hypothetical protein
MKEAASPKEKERIEKKIESFESRLVQIDRLVDKMKKAKEE